MNKNIATVGEFDLKDAISRTAERCNCSEATAEHIVKGFLAETENGLAEFGRIEYLGHFSITLRKRKPRAGTFKGEAWTTPARVEPKIKAFGPLKSLIEAKQGIECV